MKNANFSEYCFYLEENFQMYNALPFTFKFPLDETHLDSVRGLILPRSLHPEHQVELVGAMRLCSTRTNRSPYAYAKDLIQSWRI